MVYGETPLVTTTADQPDSAPVKAGAIGRCPWCGAEAQAAFVARDRNRELSPQPFRYRRCPACATLSLVDVPEDLSRFYPTSYYELPHAQQLDGLVHAEEHKVRRIRAYVEPGRLVEIGPGAGVFAYAAKRAGFDVTAIEMDERAATHLRATIGVAAIHSDDPVAALADLPPSRAIALWHVVEHLPDPVALLIAAAENLEPGGVLAIATPNPQSLQFRLLGARWAHVDAPRHLFLIPLDTLTRRLAAAGLRRVDFVSDDPGGRHWNRFGWEYALRRRPAAGPAPRPVALAAVGLMLLLRRVERGLRGAAYTAIFVKDGA